MSVITLRIPDDLKQRLSAVAASRGESLNHFIESIALQALVAEETTRRIEARRARGSAKRALEVLDRVPDCPPIAPDRPAKAPPAPARRARSRPTKRTVTR